MNLKLPPYATLLGISVFSATDEEVVLTMPYADTVMGRPGFLHGGAIAGLLEMALAATLHQALGDTQGEVRVKPINMTVNFMRGGRELTTYATAHIDRLGTRVANVEAIAWQEDRAAPIATAMCNFLKG